MSVFTFSPHCLSNILHWHFDPNARYKTNARKCDALIITPTAHGTVSTYQERG